ncbi:hypothetical protein HKL94_00555 [Candidatus Parcubacteria bacterium]|nr:hypothetical protein [Candidatus Parcubacteria bacterium]
MKSNTIILIVITLAITAGAYYYFFTGTGNQPPLTTSTSFGNVPQAQFQTLVAELQPISFDTSIFSDPRFMALIDLATPIAPEAAGRPDPFAPIPGVSGN